MFTVWFGLINYLLDYRHAPSIVPQGGFLPPPHHIHKMASPQELYARNNITSTNTTQFWPEWKRAPQMCMFGSSVIENGTSSQSKTFCMTAQ